MRVLVVTIAPIYWALARESGRALNGYSLTGGSFQQESHMEFSTGEHGLLGGGERQGLREPRTASEMTPDWVGMACRGAAHNDPGGSGPGP